MVIAMNYKEAVGFINSFTKSGGPQTDISRFRGLCERLGDPQKHLKFLHVAGTNGKGSVCAYLDGALRAAGLRTGCFTSPYIVDLRERIRLCGENISESTLAGCLEQVRNAVNCSDRADFSQFEIFTAAALLYYEREKPDYVVLETGIGGLYDCTNIVTPELCVITKIDFDHCALLGKTIPEIAAHKAGIIKPGIPAFTSPNQREQALEVLQKKAKKENAPFTEADVPLVRENSLRGTIFVYKGKAFSTKMGGAHQPENAAAAIEALRFLKIPENAISEGLRAVLPARMQLVLEDPPLIIDGGHNESGALAARALLEAENLRPAMVLGMLSTKDWEKSLSVLLGQASHAFFTDSFSPLAVPAEKLCTFASSLGVPSEVVHNEEEAMKAAVKTGNAVFAGGSLYLAGSLLAGSLLAGSLLAGSLFAGKRFEK